MMTDKDKVFIKKKDNNNACGHLFGVSAGITIIVMKHVYNYKVSD